MCSRVAERWLMYVTEGEDVRALTRLLGGVNTDWKVLAVSPNRVADAVGAIQPQVVVFDSSLGQLQELQVQVRRRCCQRTVVTNDADLSGLNQLLSSMGA